MAEFIEEEVEQTLSVEDVVRDAFTVATKDHRTSIEKEYKRRRDVIAEAERAAIEKEKFR